MSDAAAPATNAVPAAPAGGKSKLMIIVVGVVFVLLLGGGGVTYFMMKGSSAAEDTEASADAPAAKNAKTDKKKPAKVEPKSPAIYIGFEPPFVVNFPAGSAVKFLQLTVQIMTREVTVEHHIKGNDPAIRDALLTLFGQQSAEKLATPEGKEALRAEALQAVRGVIKREGGEADKIEAVYFTSFVMQ
jgi:flagellar FliL protein